MPKIILATGSPYRKKAFKMLGVPFSSRASRLHEEYYNRPENPIKLVEELARKKAALVAKKYKNGIIVGFDSVGYFQNKILEKPKNREEAYERLIIMSGKNFQFYTGICLINAKTGKKYERVAGTDADMRNIGTREIAKYLDEDPRFTTYALGFDPLNHSSASFIKKIEGSYNNIIYGLPLELTAEMLDNLKK